MGIRHVMDSRSLSFADEILQATSGGGVNIVLNRLTGEFIQKSFSVLAQGGPVHRNGKREIWLPAEVAAIRDDVVYSAFDLMERAREEPAFVGELFNRLNFFLKNGGIRPLPMEVFPLRNVIDAYRFMSKARHIGKVVVVQARSSASRSHATPGRLAADSTYLIAGELGSEGMDLCRRRGRPRVVATATSYRGISRAGRGGSGRKCSGDGLMLAALLRYGNRRGGTPVRIEFCRPGLYAGDGERQALCRCWWVPEKR